MLEPEHENTTHTVGSSTSGGSGKGLWGRVKKQTSIKKKQAKLATQNAKLRHEMRQIDLQITARQELFGVELYDALEQRANADPMFLIDNTDCLNNIQGEFVACFKDNKALQTKRIQKEDQIEDIHQQRQARALKALAQATLEDCSNKELAESATVTPMDKVKNGAKAANNARKEAGAKQKIKLVDDRMTKNKKKFGLLVYFKLVQLEYSQHFVPQNREVRQLYDRVRQDVIGLKAEKETKALKLEEIQNTIVQ